MKRDIILVISLFFLIAFALPLSAQEKETGILSSKEKELYSVSVDDADYETVPALLGGIWENAQRYLSFDTDTVPRMVLRTFYQWYNDRAAESAATAAENPRDRNDAVSRTVQELSVRFVPLLPSVITGVEAVAMDDGARMSASTASSGAWDVQIRYPGDKTVYHVPVAVIGDSLYLDFAIRYPDTVIDEFGGNPGMNGFWVDEGSASGLLLSPPYVRKELLCYYVADEGVYPVRYWLTDMDYDAEGTVFLEKDGKSHSVPRHLIIGERKYACTKGRRKTVRNVVLAQSLPECTVNGVLYEKGDVRESLATICAFGEPYMTRMEGSMDLDAIVKEANSRRKPPRPPLFPAHGILDFDWSIRELPPATFDRRMLDLGK